MGAKPVVELAPFIMTKATRTDTVWIKGPIWFYIFTHLKQWSKLGTRFDLPIISEENLAPSSLVGMRIADSRYTAEVEDVTYLGNKTVLLRIKIRRRAVKKETDYRYGGVINYLSDRAF